MEIAYISLAFAQLPDTELDEFAANVIKKMTGNAVFPAPVIALTSLRTAHTAFNRAIAAMKQGGTQLSSARIIARTTLIALLRTQASYVQEVADGNAATILQSGFQIHTRAAGGAGLNNNCGTPLSRMAA